MAAMCIVAIKKPLEAAVFVVRVKGLEPPWGKPHTDLNRTRLPIPPHPHVARKTSEVDNTPAHCAAQEVFQRPEFLQIEVLQRYST